MEDDEFGGDVVVSASRGVKKEAVKSEPATAMVDEDDELYGGVSIKLHGGAADDKKNATGARSAAAGGDDDDDDDEEEEVAITLTNDNKGKPALRFTGSNRYVRGSFGAGVGPHAAMGSASAQKADGEGDEHEDLGMFGGRRTAFDVDIDMLEDKPWRKPGVDISDYFNYGFDEHSWRVCLESAGVLFFFLRGTDVCFHGARRTTQPSRSAFGASSQWRRPASRLRASQSLPRTPRQRRKMRPREHREATQTSRTALPGSGVPWVRVGLQDPWDSCRLLTDGILVWGRRPWVGAGRPVSWVVHRQDGTELHHRVFGLEGAMARQEEAGWAKNAVGVEAEEGVEVVVVVAGTTEKEAAAVETNEVVVAVIVVLVSPEDVIALAPDRALAGTETPRKAGRVVTRETVIVEEETVEIATASETETVIVSAIATVNETVIGIDLVLIVIENEAETVKSRSLAVDVIDRTIVNEKGEDARDLATVTHVSESPERRAHPAVAVDPVATGTTIAAVEVVAPSDGISHWLVVLIVMTTRSSRTTL